jgi:hypothetical protein
MAQAPERARFEYHRSHLLYYRKHRGPLAVAFLRVYLAALGLRMAVAGVAPGPRHPAHDRWALLRLALGHE